MYIQTVKQLKKDNSGIALVLAIIILANLMMITLIVTDVILRIGKSSQQIGEGEVAYYAAESATEEAMYQIEKYYNASNLGTFSAPTSDTMTDANAHWSRYIEPIYNTERVICVDNDNKINYHELGNPMQMAAIISQNQGCIYENNPNDPINNANYLIIALKNDVSFQLELDINAASEDFYPDRLDIRWTVPTSPSLNPNGKIIVLDKNNSSQTIYDTENIPQKKIDIPSPPIFFENNPNINIRIINNEPSVGFVAYQIRTNDSDEFLPIGIRINAKGFYKTTKERVIETERRNWQIY